MIMWLVYMHIWPGCVHVHVEELGMYVSVHACGDQVLVPVTCLNNSPSQFGEKGSLMEPTDMARMTASKPQGSSSSVSQTLVIRIRATYSWLPNKHFATWSLPLLFSLLTCLIHFKVYSVSMNHLFWCCLWLRECFFTYTAVTYPCPSCSTLLRKISLCNAQVREWALNPYLLESSICKNYFEIYFRKHHFSSSFSHL